MHFLRRLFVSKDLEVAHSLYTQVVRIARQPIYYQRYQIADTLDGRFDAIVAHLFLLDEALRAAGDRKLSVTVQEVFIRDMDKNLREMGVGDLSVGKQIKKMGAAMLGRFQAYRDALAGEESQTDAPDTAYSGGHDAVAALADALWRNVYRAPEDTAVGAHSVDLAKLLIALRREWRDKGSEIRAGGPVPQPVAEVQAQL